MNSICRDAERKEPSTLVRTCPNPNLPSPRSTKLFPLAGNTLLYNDWWMARQVGRHGKSLAPDRQGVMSSHDALVRKGLFTKKKRSLFCELEVSGTRCLLKDICWDIMKGDTARLYDFSTVHCPGTFPDLHPPLPPKSQPPFFTTPVHPAIFHKPATRKSRATKKKRSRVQQCFDSRCTSHWFLHQLPQAETPTRYKSVACDTAHNPSSMDPAYTAGAQQRSRPVPAKQGDNWAPSQASMSRR